MATNVKIGIKYDFKKAKNDFQKLIKEIETQSKGVNVKLNADNIKKTNDALKTTAKTTKKVTTETTQANNAFKVMGGQLLHNLKAMAEWGIIASLLYGNLRRLRESVEFITVVDTAMSEVRMVTNLTNEDTKALVETYLDMGEELKISSKAIAEASVQLFRQGLATEEVNSRLRDFIKLSKVLGTNLTTTVEKATAGVNSLEVDSARLGDVVTSIGASAATSGEEILTIVQRAGATADATGVSLEKLAATGGVISAKTRLSAETVGASLNTILSKFSQVDALTGDLNKDYGKIIDRTDELGIATQGLGGTMLDAVQIITNIGEKWDTLSIKQRSYLTTAIGVRQFNRFAAALSDVSENQRLLEVAQNSAGTVAQQYIEYQGTIAAKNEELKVSFERLAVDTLDSQVIKSLVGLTTKFVELVNETNLIETSIVVFGASLVALTGKMITTTLATNALAGAFLKGGLVNGLKFAGVQASVLYANLTSVQIAMGVTTLGLSVLVGGIIAWNKHQEQAIINLKQTATELARINAESKETEGLISRYEELGNTVEKTTAEQGEYLRLQEQLNTALPEATTLINNQTTALDTQIAVYSELNEKLKETAKLQAQEAIAEYASKYEDAKISLDAVSKSLSEVQSEIDILALKQANGIQLTKEEQGELNTLILRRKGATEAMESYQAIIDTVDNSTRILTGDTISATEAYRDYRLALNGVIDAEETHSEVQKENTQIAIEQLETYAQLYPEATEAIINAEIDQTNSLIEEAQKRIMTRELEIRSLQALANAHLAAIRASGAPEAFIRQQEDAVAGLAGDITQELITVANLKDRLSGLNKINKKYFETAKKSKKETIDLMKSYEDLVNQLEDTVFVTNLFGEAMSRTEGEKQIPILKAQNDQYKLQQKIISSLIETIQKDINVKDLNAEQTRELEEEVQSLQLELSSLDTAFNSNLNTIKDINKAIEDDLLEQMEKLKEELEDTADIIADKLNEALEDEIDLIEEQKKAVEERFDAEIQLVQDSINRLEKRNDALEDEKRLQEALLDVENARLKLSNIKAEKDVLLFTGGGATGFELVADPREVFQAEQDLAQSEKSLEELRVQQKQDAELSKLELKVAELEAEKEAELEFYDTQIENLQTQQELIQENIKNGNAIQEELLDDVINSLETTELDSFEQRIDNVKDFVNEYNAVLRKLGDTNARIGGSSRVGSVSGASAINKATANLPDTIPSRANGMEDGLVPGGLTLLHPKEGVVNQPQMSNVVKTFQDLALGNMPQINSTGGSQGTTIQQLTVELPGVENANQFAKELPAALNINTFKSINRTRS